MVQSTAEVLEERGTRYGTFKTQAIIAQSLHIVLEEGMKLSGKTRYSFSPDQMEAVNMIVNKLARIYNGDPHYADSWRDIAGYATLVADRLDNDTEQRKRLIEAREQYERNRNPEDVKADRGGDAESPAITEGAGAGVGVDSRPTGQPELRRMPVRLQVHDVIHRASSETQPGVSATPGR